MKKQQVEAVVNDTATMDCIQKEKHGKLYDYNKHGEVLGIEITEYRDYLIK